MGTQRVQQDREAHAAGDGELAGEYPKLSVHGRAGSGGRPVEAALPHPHGAATGERHLEVGEMSIVVARGEIGKHLRVDAEPGVDPGPGARKGKDGLPPGRPGRRHHKVGHSRVASAPDDVLAVGIELTPVDVAVRVDHGARGGGRRPE